MAVYVNTNVSSLHGRRQLNNVQNQLSTTYQRLSSGLRINSAKDDAAGLKQRTLQQSRHHECGSERQPG